MAPIIMTPGRHSFLLCIVNFLFLALCSPAPAEAADISVEQLPELNREGTYRTPRAGEGFRTEVFGREVIVHPRDRRSTAAWDLSFALYEPGPENGSEIIPIGVLTFWEHPDDEHLFRAQISGVYDEIFWANPLPRFSFLEGVLTFENFSVPVAQSELVDGRYVEPEEVVWGYVRPGFGLGYRRQVSPGRQENMAAFDFTIEPGFLYFSKGSKTAENFAVPRDTFVLRGHIQMRLDGLERNLLELPHQGIAAGADLIYGYRSHWQNWGTNGAEHAEKGRTYQSYTGYFLVAGAIPGINSERHRLIGVVHAGAGHNVDRFSAPRIGGGPNPMGEEYDLTADPVLPGAVVQEFFPDHYLLFTGEYRWEPVFFAYLGFNAAAARLDRLRGTGAEIVKKTDTFTAVGARLTSAFFFHTRLQLAYNYNFSVVRDGRYGGHEIIVSLARNF